jgi:hypothetical protein
MSRQGIDFFILKQVPLPEAQEPILDFSHTVPKVLELSYTSWDLKPFADDLWESDDPSMQALIRTQWEQNRAQTGGHEWNVPEDAFINENGIPLPPFKWDEVRRAQLRAELDAYYARLYGLTRDELRYILDPKEVHGEDFPGETFRVLKEKEIKQFGEYRTRRLVLESWDKLAT